MSSFVVAAITTPIAKAVKDAPKSDAKPASHPRSGPRMFGAGVSPKKELAKAEQPQERGIPNFGGNFGGGRRSMPKSAPKKMAKGGSVSSASKRADGCATKGKTRGKLV